MSSLVLSDGGVIPPTAGVSANRGAIPGAAINIWRVGLREVKALSLQ